MTKIEKQENQSETITIQKAPPAPEPEPTSEFHPDQMPVIPNEMAISYDEIIDVLKKKSGVNVGKNDPILMMVPFLNAFLALEIKIINAHHDALCKTMSEKTAGYVYAVNGMVKDFEKTISSKAIEALSKAFQDNLEAMARYNDYLKKFSLFVVVGIIFQIGILFGFAIGLFTMGK